MRTLFTILISILCISSVAADIQPIGLLGKEGINQISFLPDGTILRVLSNHIEIADANNDVIIARLAEQSQPIWRVVVSPDGRLVVIKRQKTVELWNLAARKELHQWEQASPNQWSGMRHPFQAAFSPISPLLAITNGYDQITLWNGETGEQLGRLQDKRRPIQSCYFRSGPNWSSTRCSYVAPFIFSMAFSPDGRFLVVGSKRPDAEVWDVSTRRLVGRLEGHGGWVSVVSYSPDGRWIATAEPESTKVYLWDAQTRQLVRKWHNGEIGKSSETGEVLQLFFSPDSRRLYVVTRTRYPAYWSSGNDGVRIWDVETGEQVGGFSEAPVALKQVSVSPDERWALLQYHDGVIILWDIEKGRRLALWAEHIEGYARSLLSPDGKSLVQVFPTVIKIWDVPTQSLRKVIFQGEENYRGTVAISPDSQSFAVGLYVGGIEVRDLRTGELTTHIPDVSSYTALAFSQTGQRIASYTGEPLITIFDINNPQRREALETTGGDNNSAVYHIAFSNHERYLAAADGNSYIHLWRKKDGRYVHQYSWIALRTNVYGANLEFRPNTSTFPTLVAESWKGVEAWQLEEHAPKLVLTLDAKSPAQFIRDGRYLFVNQDEQLQIWDWRANKQISHPPIPAYFAVSRDGSVLLTRDEMGLIHIWDGTLLLPDNVVAVEPLGKKLNQWGAIKRNALLQNFPNPFNPETWIPYQLAEATHVRIKIYDLSGRLVRTLDLGEQPAGSYLNRQKAAYWDGRNDLGEPVSSGVYFYTLEAGDFRTTRRMSVVR